ncbi:MAG: PAS domain S-box protein [Vitreoscilla sp.]|nr:PAS domain S-box protein [Vitreoscilla sp.]
MASTSLFERIAEDSPDGVVLVGEGGLIKFWNRTAEHMFGHPRERALGQRLDALLLQPADGTSGSAGAKDAGHQRWPQSYEAVARCADGALLYVNAASRPLVEPDGTPVGEVYNLADVTLPKMRRDAQLIESRYRELLDSMPDAIVIVNDIGRIVLVNAHAEAMFGYEPHELVGASLTVLLPERYRATHGLHRERYMSHPHTRPMGRGLDLYGLRKGGEEFPVEISLSPLRTDVGTLGMSAIRDISERRRVERVLEEKNLELERANRAKDRFLATMSHELRTPLNAIIGFTGILLMRLPGPLTTDQESQLGMVQSSGRHLLSLINDLLDLAKIDSGSVQMQLVPVDCGVLVDEVATTLRPSASAKGLGVTLDLPDRAVLVLADRRALQQILINLANNAIKFTERGGVSISLREHREVDQDRVTLTVADTGIGMSAEDQAQLFQAFTQVGTPALRARVEGTGLGLYLCRKLAELLGGRIEVSSQLGQGSRFSLTLQGQGPG